MTTSRIDIHFLDSTWCCTEDDNGLRLDLEETLEVESGTVAFVDAIRSEELRGGGACPREASLLGGLATPGPLGETPR